MELKDDTKYRKKNVQKKAMCITYNTLFLRHTEQFHSIRIFVPTESRYCVYFYAGSASAPQDMLWLTNSSAPKATLSMKIPPERQYYGILTRVYLQYIALSYSLVF